MTDAKVKAKVGGALDENVNFSFAGENLGWSKMYKFYTSQPLPSKET